MNFLGMGTFEVAIILLVAFLFLGPERMIDSARMLGKVLRDIRKMTSGYSEMLMGEVTPEPPDYPVVHRGGGPRWDEGPPDSQSEVADAGDSLAADDGPVAFRSGPAATPVDTGSDEDSPRAPENSRDGPPDDASSAEHSEAS